MPNNLDEHSPLIQSPFEDDDLPSITSPLAPLSTGRTESDDYGDSRSTPKSVGYLFLLTVVMGGLQICWSVELAYGSPYLISLGLSKALLAFVWIAGPLSGTLMQPYVGFWSDGYRSKWGKRRPFIVAGGIATIISFLCLAWAREIVALFLGIFGVEDGDPAVNTVAIIFAVVAIYVLDFAINAIQAATRAFIVDSAPAHQQNDANAWASRISGVGNIIGYLSGYTDLPSVMPFFGNTQFKVLCVIASIVLFITTAITVCSITERDTSQDSESKSSTRGLLGFFIGLYRSVRKLPTQLMKVNEVEFFAWIAWFPVLFYTSTFIASIYAEPFFQENPDLDAAEIERIWTEGTRLASFSLLIFACTTLASSIVLPLMIQPTFQAPTTASKPAIAYARTPPSAFAGSDYFSGALGNGPRSLFARFRWLSPPWRVPGLTVRRLWIISHLLLTLAMFLTLFVRTTTGATVLLAFIGVPWAVNHWAPYAIIAAEVGKREAIRNGLIKPASSDRDAQLLADGEDPAEGADQAGIVLGIHNIFIAAPQIIATLVSSLIFKLLQKPRGQPGDDSTGWVLRFGGLAAIGAAILTARIKEERG